MSNRGISTGRLLSAGQDRWGNFLIEQKVYHSSKFGSHKEKWKLKREYHINLFKGDSPKFKEGDNIAVVYEKIGEFVLDEETGRRDKWAEYFIVIDIYPERTGDEYIGNNTSSQATPNAASPVVSQIDGEDADTF